MAARQLLFAALVFLSHPHLAAAAEAEDLTWYPLEDAAELFGLSVETVDLLAESGFKLQCSTDKGFKSSNAWSLGDPINHLCATKHGLDGADSCSLQSFRDLMSGGAAKPLPLTLSEFSSGNWEPGSSWGPGDFSCSDYKGASGAFPFDWNAIDLRVNQTVFLVSQKPSRFERDNLKDAPVIIQRCHIEGIEVTGGQAGTAQQILLDCFAFPGISGGMLFVKDRTDRSSLHPVGILGGADQPFEGREYTVSGGLLLNASFFRAAVWK